MKVLNLNELVSFCEWLAESLTGAQLQDLWTDGKLLVMQFYKNEEIYLLLNVDANKPVLWVQKQKPPVKRQSKPVTLFLVAHGRNRYLNHLCVLFDLGRVIELEFGAVESKCRIQIDLIPKHVNIFVQAGGKQIYWNRPSELPAAQNPAFEKLEINWIDHCELMRSAFFSKNQKSEVNLVEQNMRATALRAIEKKKKALLSLEQSLGSDLVQSYRLLGESLKVTTELPAELKNLYQEKKSRTENMEYAFQKAKDLQRKKIGTAERIEILNKEISNLESALSSENLSQLLPTKISRLSHAMEKSETRGRRLDLDDGIQAAIGKSGADNLALLRQAKPWDLWMHFKDEPGAHALIFRNRDQTVTRAQIEKVFLWVLKEARKNKIALLGQKFDVIVAECRFVKPIKGDRLGRVQYQNGQVYTFASNT